MRITHIVEFYTERMLEIKVDEDLRASDFIANFNHWKETQSWWPDYIFRKEIEGFIAYALRDPDYQSRVATSHFLTYDVYLPELEKFRDGAHDIITMIEEAGDS